MSTHGNGRKHEQPERGKETARMAKNEAEALKKDAAAEAREVKRETEQKAEKVKEEAKELKAEATEAASEVAHSAKEAAATIATEAKQAAANVAKAAKNEIGAAVDDTITGTQQSAANTLHSAAEKLRQQKVLSQAAVADHAADSIDEAATYLSTHNLAEMQSDLRRLVREYPLGSLAVALLIGWFLGGFFGGGSE